MATKPAAPKEEVPEELGFWDDPDVKSAGGTDYAKFVDVGDKVGPFTIDSLSKRVFNEGKPEARVAVEIHGKEDGTPIVTAGQTMFLKTLNEFKPRVGDTITVELTGINKSSGKTLKLFAITVERPDGTVSHVDHSKS